MQLLGKLLSTECEFVEYLVFFKITTVKHHTTFHQSQNTVWGLQFTVMMQNDFRDLNYPFTFRNFFYCVCVLVWFLSGCGSLVLSFRFFSFEAESSYNKAKKFPSGINIFLTNVQHVCFLFLPNILLKGTDEFKSFFFFNPDIMLSWLQDDADYDSF